MLKSSPIVLADDSGNLARIVIDGFKAPAVEFAGEELAHYLSLMTGSKAQRRGWSGPRIVLRSDAYAEGESNLLPLGREGFEIKRVDSDLLIQGESPRAVLYGAYELLERVGCRWLTPLNEQIPRMKRVILQSLPIRDRPAFKYRDLFGSHADDMLWRVRNRFNGYAEGAIFPDYLGGNERYDLWVHTFYQLVPPEEFFGEHPEYFSLIQGRRRHEGGQLCLSSTEVRDIVVERVLEAMSKNREARYFSVSPNDWFNPCECAECQGVVARTGAEAGILVEFVNYIAERTRGKHPDKFIETLAYQYTLDAPRNVKVDDNVIIRICPIFCCQAHPFGSCEHEESRRFLKAFKEWAKLTKRLHVWHYFPNFSHYVLPMPNFDELAGNARYYHRAGVEGIFWQGEKVGESVDLRRYLMAKVSWNPQRDSWGIVDEWLRGMYGEGIAGHLRQYYDLFHERVRRNGGVCVDCIMSPTSPLFDAATLKCAAEILGKALMAKGKKGAHAAVSQLSDGVAYARLWRSPGEFRVEGDYYGGEATADDLAEFTHLVPRLKKMGYNKIKLGEELRDVFARFEKHRLLSIDLGVERLMTAPSLGGRLVEWHSEGRQWLSPTDPDDEWVLIPYNGGYTEDMRVEGNDVGRGAKIERTEVIGDTFYYHIEMGYKVRAERRVKLVARGIEVDTTFYNFGSEPQRLTWSASWRFHAPKFDEVRVGRRRISERRLPDKLKNGKILMMPEASYGTWSIGLPNTKIKCNYEMQGLNQVIVARCDRIGLLAIDYRAACLIDPDAGEVTIKQRLRLSTTA